VAETERGDKMSVPYYDHDGVTLYQGDCLEVLPQLEPGSIDAIITDPTYPDYYTDLYTQTDIDFLSDYHCRQLVFWSSKAEFPLDYTAIHIWDKKTGAGSEYERIFECNGQRNYKVFREYLINSTVAASYTNDIFTGHPSQKPARLMRKLLEFISNPGDIIFDPFMGSGTTGVACVQTGRRFIGCEIDPGYFAIAEKRIKQAQLQIRMDI
jgi:site-specific DNA-methyltransferase (adenine-specific)